MQAGGLGYGAFLLQIKERLQKIVEVQIPSPDAFKITIDVLRQQAVNFFHTCWIGCGGTMALLSLAGMLQGMGLL